MFDFELMRRLSAVASVSDAEVEQLRNNREFSEDAERSFESTADPRVDAMTDAEVAGLISDQARDTVIGFEVGSRQLYEKKYIVPEWPKGQSGVTIGIGYDVGYNTAEDVKKHWDKLISDTDIQRLTRACGVTGARAGQIVSDFKDIRVPWDAAIAAYERSTMPKFGRLVLKAFPNSSELKGHCFGALFSLVFNRGSSLSGDRRKEMRNIRDACSAKKYNPIPQEFRDMCDLWKGQGLSGLIKRRNAEAVLFERGLEEMQKSVAVASASLQHESLQPPAAVDGDGLYADEDEIEKGVLERAGDQWVDVKWPANDDDAPDYQHITDRALSKTAFEFDGAALEMLIKANSFNPNREHGRLIFALRGAELVTSLDQPGVMMRQQDRTALKLRDTRPNHKDFHCVIGVYDLITGRISGFASSTVPNRGAVAGYFDDHQAGNMMPAGCYSFEVGWHLQSIPERKIPGCLIENGRQKCVLRSTNNKMYDLEDTWENNRLHGDNLHPAKSAQSASFSSLGCLVVSGGYDCPGTDRSSGTHTGEWALFRKFLGLTKPATGDHGKLFDVVVLTGLEAAIASSLSRPGNSPAEPLVQSKLGRIRYGSRGERVKRLQRGLGLRETGMFSHDVLKAWTERQRHDFGGKAQGAYGPDADATYRFGVFAPLDAQIASASASRTQFESRESGSLSDQSNLENLYYEIGLHAEAARRNPSANTSTLESLGDTNLEAINLEYGFAALKSTGANLVAGLERQIQQRICADPVGSMLGRNEIRDKIDSAAKGGVESLKRGLATLLTGVVTGVPFISNDFAARIVDALFERILRPVAGDLGVVLTDHVEISAKWLCERWCNRLGAPLKTAAVPAASTEPPVAPTKNEPQIAVAINSASSNDARQPSRLTSIIGNIEQAATGSAPDAAGVRQFIRDLRGHLDKSGDVLTPSDTKRLLAALCDTPFMAQLPGAIGGDPYGLMREIEALIKKVPPDKAAARAKIADLHALLADARMKLQSNEVQRFLKVVRSARLYEELSLLADRFAARDPSLIGAVTTAYAQGLIDSGRLVSGIEMLHAAEDHGILAADEAKEAAGILGRGHKQIYVNHIKSPSDARALQDSFGTQLSKSVESYGRIYDPSRPGENSYQGINYIAMLKRAERDGIAVQARGKPDDMARDMISALTPLVTPETKEHWLLATVAEAYLALGQYDKAAAFYALYVNHPGVDAFALNSTIRQLEEVWQLKAGTAGADAILTNLKAALAQKEGGFVSLSSAERQSLKGASNVQFSEHFERVTPGGKYVNFATLKRIVICGASVAAIQLKSGNGGQTQGTGFLVKGTDFSPALPGDKSYILTNAHVLWDAAKSNDQASSAVTPDQCRIIFENDAMEGRSDFYRCARVVWQSPSSLLDATLIELDRRVDHTVPLELAPATPSLSVASDTTADSKLAVLGHPNGKSLALGVLGNLDQMQGALIDRGPRANSENPVFLHYVTPTEPGNSGSPVFDADSWRVVALHHSGYPERGWPKLGGKPGFNEANEGIWIESIRAAVHSELAENSAKSGGRRRWWG